MNQTIGLLEKYFAYYRKLDSEQKKEFERRVENFTSHKEFVPRGELTTVSEEMKVLAAANAVQLTFGLHEIYFDHFKTILFYPDEFYSNYSLSYQTKEVHPDGYIVFSWKHLALGNLLPDKVENIGLQAFAQVIGIQNNTDGIEFDILENSHLRQWKSAADRDFEKIGKEGKDLYKNRSLKREDFFPVSVEYFFEKPDVLKKEFPDLHTILANLLNQNS